jgi:hypothetical protein
VDTSGAAIEALDCDVDGGAFAGGFRGREAIPARFDALCSIKQDYWAVEVAYSLSISRRGRESVYSSFVVLFEENEGLISQSQKDRRRARENENYVSYEEDRTSS